MLSTQTPLSHQVGEILELSVEGFSSRGEGIAYANEEKIFVKAALPGDLVQARLIRKHRGRWEAELLKIQTPSPARVVPRCQHFGTCGGCSLQHLNYAHQVNWKIQHLESQLREQLHSLALPPIELIPMTDPWAYRGKVEFTFGQQPSGITLGFHERGSFNRIVDVTTCSIAGAGMNALLQAIKETAARFPYPAYDPRSHQGFWRTASVRSTTRGELMLMIVTQEGPQEPIQALADLLPKQVPALKSLFWGISTKLSDGAQPDRMTLLFGSETLEDQVGQIRYRIGPKNFVQPNLVLASQVYEAIRSKAALTGREVVYDLYSGIGLVALSLASQAREVVGVESEPENVATAERNAKLNGLDKALFLCGKVEDLLKEQALFKLGPSPFSRGAKPDVIVLDPPRPGLHKGIYAPLLAAQARRLLYLSCNPETLIRDLKILLTRDPGYRMEAIQLFDFFPQTLHKEVLVTLKRQG